MFFEELLNEYHVDIYDKNVIKIKDFSKGEKVDLCLLILDACAFGLCAFITVSTLEVFWLFATLITLIILFILMKIDGKINGALRKQRTYEHDKRRVDALYILLEEKNYVEKLEELIRVCEKKKERVRGWDKLIRPTQSFFSICLIPASIAALSAIMEYGDKSIKSITLIVVLYIIICIYFLGVYTMLKPIAEGIFDKKIRLITFLEDDLMEIEFQYGTRELKNLDAKTNKKIYCVEIQCIEV